LQDDLAPLWKRRDVAHATSLEDVQRQLKTIEAELQSLGELLQQSSPK
jgi:hypothetical protein